MSTNEPSPRRRSFASRLASSVSPSASPGASPSSKTGKKKTLFPGFQRDPTKSKFVEVFSDDYQVGDAVPGASSTGGARVESVAPDEAVTPSKLSAPAASAPSPGPAPASPSPSSLRSSSSSKFSPQMLEKSGAAPTILAPPIAPPRSEQSDAEEAQAYTADAPPADEVPVAEIAPAHLTEKAPALADEPLAQDTPAPEEAAAHVAETAAGAEDASHEPTSSPTASLDQPFSTPDATDVLANGAMGTTVPQETSRPASPATTVSLSPMPHHQSLSDGEGPVALDHIHTSHVDEDTSAPVSLDEALATYHPDAAAAHSSPQNSTLPTSSDGIEPLATPLDQPATPSGVDKHMFLKARRPSSLSHSSGTEDGDGADLYQQASLMRVFSGHSAKPSQESNSISFGDIAAQPLQRKGSEAQAPLIAKPDDAVAPTVVQRQSSRRITVAPFGSSAGEFDMRGLNRTKSKAQNTTITFDDLAGQPRVEPKQSISRKPSLSLVRTRSNSGEPKAAEERRRSVAPLGSSAGEFDMNGLGRTKSKTRPTTITFDDVAGPFVPPPSIPRKSSFSLTRTTSRFIEDLPEAAPLRRRRSIAPLGASAGEFDMAGLKRSRSQNRKSITFYDVADQPFVQRAPGIERRSSTSLKRSRSIAQTESLPKGQEADPAAPRRRSIAPLGASVGAFEFGRVGRSKSMSQAPRTITFDDVANQPRIEPSALVRKQSLSLMRSRSNAEGPAVDPEATPVTLSRRRSIAPLGASVGEFDLSGLKRSKSRSKPDEPITLDSMTQPALGRSPSQKKNVEPKTPETTRRRSIAPFGSSAGEFDLSGLRRSKSKSKAAETTTPDNVSAQPELLRSPSQLKSDLKGTSPEIPERSAPLGDSEERPNPDQIEEAQVDDAAALKPNTPDEEAHADAAAASKPNTPNDEAQANDAAALKPNAPDEEPHADDAAALQPNTPDDEAQANDAAALKPNTPDESAAQPLVEGERPLSLKGSIGNEEAALAPVGPSAGKSELNGLDRTRSAGRGETEAKGRTITFDDIANPVESPKSVERKPSVSKNDKVSRRRSIGSLGALAGEFDFNQRSRRDSGGDAAGSPLSLTRSRSKSNAKRENAEIMFDDMAGQDFVEPTLERKGSGAKQSTAGRRLSFAPLGSSAGEFEISRTKRASEMEKAQVDVAEV